MAQVLSMAQAFGLQPDAQTAPPSEHPPAGHKPHPPQPNQPPAAPPPFQMPDERMMGAMFQLMQQAQQSDGKQEALLCALKPYLAPERQDKIDRALQIARLSHLAGFAMRNYGDLKGGK